MRKFTDANGREWEVSIDCASIGRVYDQCGVDLGDPNDGEIPLYVRIMSGFGLLLKVLPVVCFPQINVRGLNTESFLSSIPNKGLLKLRDDFVQEWSDFFQSSGQVTASRMLTAMKQYQDAKTKMDPNSPEVKKLEALLLTVSQAPLESATTSPESVG